MSASDALEGGPGVRQIGPIAMHIEFSVRRYRPADREQILWLHMRTPAWGNVSAAPEPSHPEIDHVDDHFLAFFVAVEKSWDGADMVIGMAGVVDAADQDAFGVSLPEGTNRVLNRTADA